jgi:arylsulfatase A-like enzyme
LKHALAAGRTSAVRALVCLTILTLTACPQQPAVRSAPTKPNVLIIVTDDQRIGSLSVMPQTRHYFLQGGTNFTQAFVTTPLCCPSRSSIFSGLYAHNHGVVNNGPGLAENLDQKTLVQYYLHRDGYRTGLFGKYLNKWKTSQAPPNFDDFSFFSKAEPYHGGSWNHNGTLVSPKTYSTTYVKRLAERFLHSSEHRDAKPWFLYLATAAPHGPSIAQHRYKNAAVPSWKGEPAVFEKDRSDKPPYVLQDNAGLARGRSVRKRQLRSLMSVDDMVGQLLGLLRRLGEERRTLVFFISDNGVTWGDHGLKGKIVPYTPSIEVPMMMRWPGHVAAGRSDSSLVANIDIAPTIMDAVGLSPVHPMDGHSLLGQQTPRRSILNEYTWMAKYNVPTWASIRTDTFQYIEDYNRAGTKIRFREYYDLKRDPWQLHNLLGDRNPGNDPSVQTLSRRLAQERTCAGPDCP